MLGLIKRHQRNTIGKEVRLGGRVVFICTQRQGDLGGIMLFGGNLTLLLAGRLIGFTITDLCLSVPTINHICIHRFELLKFARLRKRLTRNTLTAAQSGYCTCQNGCQTPDCILRTSLFIGDCILQSGLEKQE